MKSTSRTQLLLIFVTVFIDLLGFGIVLPLLPRYAKHFHADGLTLGLLMASFSAMQFVFAPIWGRVSDSVGRRPVLILGLAGSTFFYTLFGYATSLGAEGTLFGLTVIPWLFITRIGAGIAGATIPTAQAYIADVTGPKERARGMALIGAAFGIGFTFGPLLGAGFVSAETDDPHHILEPAIVARLELTTEQTTPIREILDGYDHEIGSHRVPRKQRQQKLHQAEEQILPLLDESQRAQWKALSAPSAAPGYVAGIFSGLALLCAIGLLPESLTERGRSTERHWLDLRSLRSAITQPAVGLVLLTMFVTTFAFAQFESTLSLLTDFLGMADRDNYYVFAYIGLILTISQGVLVRRLAPRVGEFVLCVAGTLLMTIGLLLIGLLGQWDSRAALYVVLPLVVIGFSALTPSLQSLLSRRTAASEQGGILGLGQSFSALARILGPVVGLKLNDVNVAYPYFAGAVIMALGGLLTVMLRRGGPEGTEGVASAES